MQKQNKPTVPETPEWIMEVVSDMERAEASLPDPYFLEGDFPDWVKALSKELIGTLFPMAKLKTGKPWTAGEIGAMAGHKLAYLRGIEDSPELAVPKQSGLQEVDKKTKAEWEKWSTDAVSAWVETEIGIQKAVTLACQQPHDEAKRFFTAFTRALRKKPTDLGATNFHRTSTKVYVLIFICWKSVEKMQSVAQLHRTMCKIMEPHLVGDLKRMEKVCQRIGLRFGPRGRPKKEKIQTSTV